MFCAEISRTSPVPPDALADALAVADGSTDALADAEALADALADALGNGVTDGAGAYVQPGLADVHAARATIRAMTDREWRRRIGSGDLIGWRG
jgi:hypothetical protein